MATAPKKAPKLDTLDTFAAAARADPTMAIALMLWVDRINNPDMYVRIDQKDLKGFEDCMTYQKLVPEVRIHREPGVPAQPAVPGGPHRRAVPAREALPPKPYVVVTLVEKGTANAIRPIENNQEDYDAAGHAAKVRAARTAASGLADRLTNAAQTGDFASSDLRDAAQALLLLSAA